MSSRRWIVAWLSETPRMLRSPTGSAADTERRSPASPSPHGQTLRLLHHRRKLAGKVERRAELPAAGDFDEVDPPPLTTLPRRIQHFVPCVRAWSRRDRADRSWRGRAAPRTCRAAPAWPRAGLRGPPDQRGQHRRPRGVPARPTLSGGRNLRTQRCASSRHRYRRRTTC
jgi:hypothetical protein